MITIIDLNAELAKLTMLPARTPQTTGAQREGSMASLAPYRDGALFTSKFAGNGGWERHRNGDVSTKYRCHSLCHLEMSLQGWAAGGRGAPA